MGRFITEVGDNIDSLEGTLSGRKTYNISSHQYP